jgi:hypothetical protein
VWQVAGELLVPRRPSAVGRRRTAGAGPDPNGANYRRCSLAACMHSSTSAGPGWWPEKGGGDANPGFVGRRSETGDGAFFDRFTEPVWEPLLTTACDWAPTLGISETKDAMTVTVELPGVDPEEIEIALTDDSSP